jgi:hypothetical protein
MKGYVMELYTRILTTEKDQYVVVDENGDTVWLSVNVIGSGTRVTLTKEQAKDMIAALIRIVDAEVTK